MGIEYKHYLVAAPDRVGSPQDAVRIDEVLRDVGLVFAPPLIERLRGNVATALDLSLSGLGTDEANLRLTYEGAQGVAAIPELMGPSYWGAEDSDRYFMGVVVTVGRDFHLHPSDEMFFFEVATAPMRDGLAVQPYAGGTTYPADERTSAPVVTLTLDDEENEPLVPDGFPGVWRIGIEIDCGKDVPAFAPTTYWMPGRTLIKRLRKLLGPIFEIGSVSP